MESDRAEQRIVKLNGENDQLLAASALLLKVFQCAVGTHVATEFSFISDGRGNILPFPQLMFSGHQFCFVEKLRKTY